MARRNRKFYQKIRARMNKTGESYSTAKGHLEAASLKRRTRRLMMLILDAVSRDTVTCLAEEIETALQNGARLQSILRALEHLRDHRPQLKRRSVLPEAVRSEFQDALASLGTPFDSSDLSEDQRAELLDGFQSTVAQYLTISAPSSGATRASSRSAATSRSSSRVTSSSRSRAAESHPAGIGTVYAPSSANPATVSSRDQLLTDPDLLLATRGSMTLFLSGTSRP